MVVAARCLSEGLWGSAGASELPPTLQGEEGRKEVVSLGEWLTPSTSHYAAVLSGGGFRGSQRMLSISKQLGEGNRERGSAVISLPGSVVWLRFLSFLCILACVGARLWGFLCCFQDCRVRRESELRCS